ncbi:two-component system histidine kinase PnpS [Streptococcus ictaluri]|uniref:histidine kinase n=1 Tax=Streptococcus ictaluri 707-05 TaxID=764299 RepID=G5K245_9STRE|nr:ATP-binding protein [Streptococcus ictaluri]EHI70274.1 putative alkaline phosphatase synthesis sensor protein PhoR [Streptococcus ictaluri 707-05]
MKIYLNLLAISFCLFFLSFLAFLNAWWSLYVTLLLFFLASVTSFWALRQLWIWQKEFQYLTESLIARKAVFIDLKNKDLKDCASHLLQIKEVSQQKEAVIKDLQGNLEALTQHLTMGLLLVSSDKRILLQSHSLPDYFPGSLGVWESLDDMTRLDLRALIYQAFDDKVTLKKELSGLQDTDLILEVTAVPILTAQGSVQAVLVLLYDLTQRRQYEQLNLDFLSNASHELRTPVTAIKGFAETIQEMPPEEVALKEEFLAIIYKESLRLEHIVEDLLTLSKLKKPELQITEFDLSDFLKDIAQSLKPQLKEKNLQLRLLLADNIFLNTDHYVLSQLLLNLLSNAIRYTENGGEISIISQRKEKGIAISVRDTGIGISQMELDRIFERFYRVNKGRSRQSGGTGLGLAIVKELTQLLDGQVPVKSQLGKGSQFTVTLPEKI